MEDEEDDVRALAWRLVDKLLPARGAHASQRQLKDRSDCYTQSQRGGGGGRLRGGGGGGGEVTFRAHDSVIGGGHGRTEEGGRMHEGPEGAPRSGRGPSSCGERRAAESGRGAGVGVGVGVGVSGEDEELEYGERVGRVLLRSVRGSVFADSRVRAIRLLARFFFFMCGYVCRCTFVWIYR